MEHTLRCYTQPIDGTANSNLMCKKQAFFSVGFLGLILLISSCVCTTEFTAKDDLQILNFDEYRLKCSIQEGAYEGEQDLLNIEFDFCTFASYPKKCNNKKLIDSSVLIIPTYEGESNTLSLKSEYASTYSFIAGDWKKPNALLVNIQYQVDSAGIIISRKFNHRLVKNKNCRTRLALH